MMSRLARLFARVLASRSQIAGQSSVAPPAPMDPQSGSGLSTLRTATFDREMSAVSRMMNANIAIAVPSRRRHIVARLQCMFSHNTSEGGAVCVTWSRRWAFPKLRASSGGIVRQSASPRRLRSYSAATASLCASKQSNAPFSSAYVTNAVTILYPFSRHVSISAIVSSRSRLFSASRSASASRSKS